MSIVTKPPSSVSYVTMDSTEVSRVILAVVLSHILSPYASFSL